jgi:hypothetical protein
MKFDLEQTLKTLGWNLGLIAVFSSVLMLFGVALDQVLVIAGSMAGLQALIALAINVLKWAGVVSDGAAGKWSAILNLGGLAFVSVTLGVNPAFNFAALDAQFVDIAKFLTIIFGYVVQIAGTKHFHRFTVNALGVKAFKARAA